MEIQYNTTKISNNQKETNCIKYIPKKYSLLLHKIYSHQCAICQKALSYKHLEKHNIKINLYKILEDYQVKRYKGNIENKVKKAL